MGTPAAFSHGMELEQRILDQKRQRTKKLSDEQRQRTEKLSDEQRRDLVTAVHDSWDGMNAGDRTLALQAIQAAFQPDDKKHPLNLPAPTGVTQAPAMTLGPSSIPSDDVVTEGAAPASNVGTTLPAGDPVAFKGPAPKTWQEGLMGPIARAKDSGQLKDEESERQAQRQIEVNQAKPVRTKRDIVTGTVNGQPLTLLKDDATKEMTTLSGEPVSPEVLDAFVPTPKTQPHQLSPAVQYMNLTTKKILAEKKQGPPLTPEESAQLAAAEGALTLPGIARMQALAKYQAENNTALVTDDEGLEVLATRAQAVHAAEGGHPMLSGKVGEPTGKEKDRQDFCDSALLQVNTMRDIIKRNKGLFGPGAGRVQEFAAWVGSSSPDAQQFRTAALILADHSAGVFGGRSVKTVDELKNTITSMHLTPEALLAGLAQDEATFNKLRTATGRLPAPEAQGKATTGKKISLKKAMALPVNKGKSADEVRADIKKHGHEVLENAK